MRYRAVHFNNIQLDPDLYMRYLQYQIPQQMLFNVLIIRKLEFPPLRVL